MRGSRTIYLPINFRYSEGGAFKEDCAVTLTAPSLENFAIQTKMVAYATQALREAEKEQLQFLAEAGDVLEKILKSRAELQEAAAAEAAEEAATQAAETDDAMATRVIGMFARGLGPDKFPAFMEFLKKTLTNNAKLARVGDTKVPLKDETWNDIDEKGGMSAVNIILATFAGFFLPTAASPSAEASGNSSRPTSQSQAAVH
jgi:hypothetical protein